MNKQRQIEPDNLVRFTFCLRVYKNHLLMVFDNFVSFIPFVFSEIRTYYLFLQT